MSDPSWEPTYHASIWWCADEVCDCYQPTINLRTPNLTVGRPWMRTTNLWEGTLRSQPSPAEWDEMEDELEAACEASGIPRGISPAKGVTLTTVKRIDDEQMARVRRPPSWRPPGC